MQTARRSPIPPTAAAAAGASPPHSPGETPSPPPPPPVRPVRVMQTARRSPTPSAAAAAGAPAPRTLPAPSASSSVPSSVRRPSPSLPRSRTQPRPVTESSGEESDPFPCFSSEEDSSDGVSSNPSYYPPRPARGHMRTPSFPNSSHAATTVAEAPECCAFCSARRRGGNLPLLRCSSCKLVKYCGIQCQRDHRPFHRVACEAASSSRPPL